MGAILGGKPKAFQPSEEQRSLEKAQSEERLTQQSEMAEREALRKRMRAGRSSLLTGAATGVEQKQTTLG